MILDAGSPDRGAFARPFDICIVGSGPAGMTLARSLAAKGFDVALMEGGSFDVTVESQEMYAGEIVGLDYMDLDVVRIRVFGGCSEHWSGRTGVIPAHDFLPMPQRPLAWPITKADLDPYQPEASEIFELGLAWQPPDLALPQAEERFRNIQFRQSPPVRMGQKYRDEIAASPRITAAINANLVDMRLGPDLATVESAVFRSYDPADPGFTVSARVFALCLGGFETPRMMLNFNSQKPAGIGNDNDLVGRYFCEHPSREMALAIYTHRREIMQDNYSPTPEFMEREGILDFIMRVTWRDRAPKSLGDSLKGALECATPFTERLGAKIRGRPHDCLWGGGEEFHRLHDPDAYPSGTVWMACEQSLIRDSRVMLAEETDAFGLRRMRLDWKLDEIDYRTMLTGLTALGQHFAEQDIGRIRIPDWLLVDNPRLPGGAGAVHSGDWNGGYHQMCTTRMADDPREGVVDRNCRVHGMDNLYIGGSSVFGSPSYVNPTYTIVQLALRLGDHLGTVLPAGGVVGEVLQ
ncbi:MAG: GMC family oxidoreductase [Rhodobacteraceae bacterium]|nr:GMC family oxidoreductase [Paracoccaceae bacterium]